MISYAYDSCGGNIHKIGYGGGWETRFLHCSASLRGGILAWEEAGPQAALCMGVAGWVGSIPVFGLFGPPAVIDGGITKLVAPLLPAMARGDGATVGREDLGELRPVPAEGKGEGMQVVQVPSAPPPEEDEPRTMWAAIHAGADTFERR